MNLRGRAGRMLSSWVAFWRRVEGPELEPPIWHSHYLTHRVSRNVLNQLGRRLRGVIIDIGAGTGHGAAYLDRTHSTYFPTDLPDGRDFNDKRISKAGQAPIQLCSVYDLPFPDGHFGGGMMLMVLEHLQHPQKGLAEVFRVIAPGGLFLISVPFAFPVHGAPLDFRRWTPIGLEAELREAGFTVEVCLPCGAAFSGLAVNLHLTLRHHVALSGSAAIQKAIALSLPLLLVMQTVINLLAVVFDRVDRSGAFSLAVIALGCKPKAGR